MKPVRTFQVHPSVPEALSPLLELAFNLHWAWDPDTIALFRRLDRELWEESGHDPVRMIGLASQSRLDSAARDREFLDRLASARERLRRYLGAETWYRQVHGSPAAPLVAYFSMEFGIAECLPIYSGGLGILAGDHLKSASDLGIPLVGVGLLYQKGYFRQNLNADGWQQEKYPINDFSTMPVRPFTDAAGAPVRITLDLAGKQAAAQVWKAEVGRVTLVLLDTHLPENPPEIREITGELYGGDGERRLQQELLLGVGGLRALGALGLRARVYHMNEGHSAFLALERTRLLMKEKSLTFEEAREACAASLLFTTHTPVPAGIDVFAADLMDKYFSGFRSELGLAPAAFLDLGRVRQGDAGEPFNTTVLALRMAGRTNGVSKLHGAVSRSMWHRIWDGIPVEETPIGHITNGVHAPSWISWDVRRLYDRQLGERWMERPPEAKQWAALADIPDEDLWRVHEGRREKLVKFARGRLRRQLRARGAGAAELAAAETCLDPRALTIGFARRFATYKRATLILSDPERLAKILNDPARPAQMIFAGKAHPRDEGGKELIKLVQQAAASPALHGKIVFLENYDAVIARFMLSGCDVWLNTPRRPLEASGTSGMKAALNGTVNLSILDGWWDEAASPETGFSVGGREEFADIAVQDRLESRAIYDLVERGVIPLFYERDGRGVPPGWLHLMKRGIAGLGPVYTTGRMVAQYLSDAYLPALRRRERLEADGFARTKALAAWKGRLRAAWKDVRVTRVESDVPASIGVGTQFEVRAWVNAAGLGPADLLVELCLGHVGPDDKGGEDVLREATRSPMKADGASSDLGLLYRVQVTPPDSGVQGFTVRVTPRHEDLGHPQELGLIAWAG